MSTVGFGQRHLVGPSPPLIEVATGEQSKRVVVGSKAARLAAGAAPSPEAQRCFTDGRRRHFPAAPNTCAARAPSQPSTPPVMFHCRADAGTTVLHRSTGRPPAMFHCNAQHRRDDAPSQNPRRTPMKASLQRCRRAAVLHRNSLMVAGESFSTAPLSCGGAPSQHHYPVEAPL